MQVDLRPGRRTGSPLDRRARARPRRARAPANRRSPRIGRSPAVARKTLNWLGTMKPWIPTARRRSISRVSLRPSSTGWSWPRNALANAPSTRRSRRRSNCCSPMVQTDYSGGELARWRETIRHGREATAESWRRFGGYRLGNGRVAELADAQDSGSCVRKDVGVQVPPRPQAGRVAGPRVEGVPESTRSGPGIMGSAPVATTQAECCAGIRNWTPALMCVEQEEFQRCQ